MSKNFILIITFFCTTIAQGSESSDPYVQYKVRVGDTLSNILRRAKAYPIWTVNGSLEKTIKINKQDSKLIKNRHKLEPDQLIYLPIVKNDARYRFTESGLLILPLVDNSNYPKKMTKRNVAATKKRKINNFKLKFECYQAKDPRTFQHINKFMATLDENIENLSIEFNCPNKIDYNIARSSDGKRKFKVPPWMFSFSPQTDTSKRNVSSVQEKTSFLIPSLGFDVINYSEGSFSNNFTNAFISLRYRQIISKPYWHLDLEAKHGMLTINNSVSNSSSQILDIDVRLGRAFPVFDEPWHFTLYSGIYYSQMFVSESLYGYKGVYYPQIYPEIRRLFASGDSMTLSVKIVPTGRSFFELSGDMAVTLGLQYNTKIYQLDSFFKLDYSNINFETPNDIPVKMDRTSFGFGVVF